MSERISIKEYLENKELLELKYVPYEQRKEICNVIIEQCSNISNDYNTLNSVLLDRVKKEIFITSITNLDFSIVDEVGLDGYDQLCYDNNLNRLIDICGYLYEQFDEILELMIKDYYNNEASLRGYISNIKNSIVNWVLTLKRDTSDFIENLDAKVISDNIVKIINESQNNKI